MASNKQSRSVDIAKGLLLVRYTDAADRTRPPKVKISVSPQHAKSIELVTNADPTDATLWQPGSCLAVRARTAGQLIVEVVPMNDGGSIAATVKIETLSQGEPIAVPTEAKREQRSAHVGGLQLLGHVAGIGDVRAHADEWIAGPHSPARIEGLSIAWPDKPDDLAVHYSVKLARPVASSEQIIELGGYAGTRGRALPIIGVTLGLSGPAASQFRWLAEAAFLGAPLLRVSGKQVTLSGPTGREPLVGIKLQLETASPPLQPVMTQAGKPGSGRVRVFRSSPEQSPIAAQ